jgi:TolA-binding protein
MLLVGLWYALYKKADELYNSGKLDDAAEIWQSIMDYGDSKDRLAEIYDEQLADIERNINVGKNDVASAQISRIQVNAYTEDKLNELAEKNNEAQYQKGVQLMTDGKFDEAKEVFVKILEYKDSREKYLKCRKKDM